MLIFFSAQTLTHTHVVDPDAQQKIVIRVCMCCDKCRSKAMALAAATCGVDSVELDGKYRDEVVVVGEGVDSVKLTRALRKKVGHADLLHVSEVGIKKGQQEAVGHRGAIQPAAVGQPAAAIQPADAADHGATQPADAAAAGHLRLPPLPPCLLRILLVLLLLPLPLDAARTSGDWRP